MHLLECCSRIGHLGITIRDWLRLGLTVLHHLVMLRSIRVLYDIIVPILIVVLAKIRSIW